MEAMVELLVVIGVFVGLSGLALAAIMMPWTWLFVGGSLLALLGVVFGVPAGAYYHVVLLRELRQNGEVPPRWWIHPHHHHDDLPKEARARVKPWFFVGGAGFGVIILGALIATLGGVLGLP